MSISASLGACLTNDRRSEGDPDRADFCDRFPRIAGAYVRETIAERCRSGAAAVGEHRSARLLGRGRGGRGTRLIRFQHVAEAAQSPHLQPEGSESTAQTVYADLDRGVGRRVTPAAQTVCDRLFTDYAARAYGQRLQQRHLARRQIETRL